MGLRSGTLNVPGIVGFAEALRICLADLELESLRVAGLRDLLFERLHGLSGGVILNGPELRSDLRLAHNLNVQFPQVDGQTLMATEPDLGLSSGSACSAAHPQPSHVLRGLGLNDDEIRQSLRFGLSRFTTREEIETAAHRLAQAVQRLRQQTYLPCP